MQNKFQNLELNFYNNGVLDIMVFGVLHLCFLPKSCYFVNFAVVRNTIYKLNIMCVFSEI